MLFAYLLMSTYKLFLEMTSGSPGQRIKAFYLLKLQDDATERLCLWRELIFNGTRSSINLVFSSRIVQIPKLPNSALGK